MVTETKLLFGRSKWTALSGLCLVCIVLARLCDTYTGTHESAKYVYLLIYSFHMPAVMLMAGMAYRDAIRERRYSVLVPVFLICLLTKILTYAIASLLHQKASFSLINDSGIASYMMALGFCMLITFFVQRLNPRGVMICSIILACAAGYDNSLGDTLALSRMVVLYPFFFAGYAMDSQRLNKTLSKRALQFVAALILIIFVLSVYRYGANLYWLRPMLTGRNPFSSLSRFAGNGWLLRLIYYPVVFILVFSFLSVIPESGLPILNGIGKSAPSAFALSYVVLYLLMDLIGLRELIDSLNGALFYLVLLVVSFLIAWICARQPLDKVVRWLISPEMWRKAERQPRERVFSRSEKLNKTQLLAILTVTLFLTFTFVLYGPLTLFLGNAEDLWFSIQDVYQVVIPLFVALSIVLMVIGYVLPEKLRRIYIKLIFGVALALYIQGTYINIDYGVLDGTEIDWGQYTGYAVWSTAVWVACIALPFLLDQISKVKKYTIRILMAAAAFLLVIQIPAMVVDLVNYHPKQGGDVTVTTDGIYELSSKENIIVFLFDTLDEQYFEEYLADHPEFAKNLDGFVQYDNVLTSGARTIEAVPSILTGIPFRRETTYSQYIESIWTDETPLAALNAAGYDVRCFTQSMFLGQGSAGYIDNLVSSRQKVGSYSVLGQKLYKLTAFRFTPHLLKQFFWMNTAEFSDAIAQKTADGTGEAYIEDDAAFFRNFLAHKGFSQSKEYNKAFRFYLMGGLHAPYKLSSDGLDNSKKTSLEVQREGVFTIIQAILENLRQTDAFDSSTIIITADHGDLNRAQHVTFLYKAPGASEKLSISHAPVSLFDLYTFFYNKAGVEPPYNQYSMDFLTLKDKDDRERHFFHNSSNNASRVVVNEYATTASATQPGKLVLVHEYLGEDKDTPYNLGEILSYAADATANRYNVDGFGNTSGFRTYLQGPYARIEMPINNLPSSGTLEVRIGLSGSINKETNVSAYANGLLVLNQQEVSKKTKLSELVFSVDIASAFPNGDNTLNLEFYLDAVPMSEMELPVRNRSRSISFTTLLVQQIA